uniref:Uncharacterized protein n=1 Tax=Cyanistes caeruleus TaxID=156563 RepID=A0A8C0VBH0_CYACU
MADSFLRSQRFQRSRMSQGSQRSLLFGCHLMTEAGKDPHSPLFKEFSVVSQVSETERLCYVGQNFGNEVLKCNSLCRYFIGVLDKNSGQMEVYNAEIFNMQPLLSGGRCWESQLALPFSFLPCSLVTWRRS